MHLFIDESGNVEKVEVVEGNPLLVDAAVNAVKQWKFKPYIKGGKAVKVNIKLPVDFAFANQIKDGEVSAGTAHTDTQDPSQKTTITSNTQSHPASPLASSSGSAPTRVRVSQGVTAGLLFHRVNPIYPVEARRNHVQGRVLLNAVIGTDGNIKDLQVISGPKELVDAAVGAVQQWRYRPYLFDGQPVEVATTIEVNFQLAR